MKILFIGNSYTYFYDMPQMLQSLCLANGKDATVTSFTVGGRELHQNLDPQDEIYQKLAVYLSEGSPDVLILQEQSVLPAVRQDVFMQGVRGLCHLVSPARAILYATWGRKHGHVLTDHGWTMQDMTRLLYASYAMAAQDVGGELSPVGLCFGEMNRKHPEVELYDPDGSHPSLTGSVLALLCHYYTIFQELPLVCDGLGVDGDTVNLLQAAVMKACGKDDENVFNS